MTTIKRAILAALVLGLSTETAMAQFSFDGDSKILINAEKATYEGNKTRLEGNVDVRQGDAQILSDTMNIYRRKRPSTDLADTSLGVVTRIEAEGNFKYVTPDSTVTGNSGVYQRDRGVIIVTGNVILQQANGSRVSGDKLTYNVKTKKTRFGDECPEGNCNGRVNFNIKPGN